MRMWVLMMMHKISCVCFPDDHFTDHVSCFPVIWEKQKLYSLYTLLVLVSEAQHVIVIVIMISTVLVSVTITHAHHARSRSRSRIPVVNALRHVVASVLYFRFGAHFRFHCRFWFTFAIRSSVLRNVTATSRTHVTVTRINNSRTPTENMNCRCRWRN